MSDDVEPIENEQDSLGGTGGLSVAEAPLVNLTRLAQVEITGLDLPLAEALRVEGAAGVPIVQREGASGAARFAAGAGRHGKFDDSADGHEPGRGGVG